jgi:hypothetical protein
MRIPKPAPIYAGKPHSPAYIYADLLACGLSHEDARVYLAAILRSNTRVR